MKARCIDTGSYELTIGKVYEVNGYEHNEDVYSVIDDMGKEIYVFKTRFEIIEEENKVNKEYRITVIESGYSTSLITSDAIEAIEFIKSKDDAYKATKYIQENFENAVFDIQPDGNSVKIKVTIGDYVLTN